MVEPVSITIAVVAAFFALISAIDAGHRLYATWKEKREKGNLEGVERYLHDMMLAWKKYNCMVAHMGRAFARELDGSQQSLLESFEPLLRAANSLNMETASKIGSMKNEAEALKVENEAKSLAERANKIVDDVWKNCRGKDRSIDLTTLASDDTPLPVEPRDPHHFCKGAILLQRAEPEDESVSMIMKTTGRNDSWGFTCKYCSLTVGDYQALRISKGRPLQSKLLLAASHLDSNRSFDDFRAYYRCLCCAEEGRTVDFGNAIAFECHMQKHVGFQPKRYDQPDVVVEQTAEELLQFTSRTEDIHADTAGVLPKDVGVVGDAWVQNGRNDSTAASVYELPSSIQPATTSTVSEQQARYSVWSPHRQV